FFFQAEDGIRDYKVTGVQTCALPISRKFRSSMEFNKCKEMFRSCPDLKGLEEQVYALLFWRGEEKTFASGTVIYAEGAPLDDTRSEERRVGKECRYRWWRDR